MPDDSAEPSTVNAYGINNLGEVTGSYNLANSESHAFLYTHGCTALAAIAAARRGPRKPRHERRRR